jgi:hypothetical protein
MPKTKRKSTPKTRKKRKVPSLNSSNVVVVIHTKEKETAFPEKLKKMNELLRNAKMMHS